MGKYQEVDDVEKVIIGVFVAVIFVILLNALA